MHGAPLPSVYHRRKSSSSLSLRGCYVYSGRLASYLLSPNTASTWDPADAQGKFPRVYGQDQLRVADDEEDCSLVVFKRPFGGEGRFGKGGTTRVLRARSMVRYSALLLTDKGAPSLCGRRRADICCRGGTTELTVPCSKQIERDEMVFALNQAIERLNDGEQERETRLTDFSWLKTTS